MTREEAIKEHERAFDVLDHSCHMDNRRKEAFNMARLALSSEPFDDATLKDIFCMGCEYKEQEPCEDCISRQAVLDMRKKIEYKDMWHMTQEEEVVSVSNIKALPPVTPKPKTDVLDKIRAEIVQMPTISFNANDIYKADILAIIDKYKSEGKK